MGPVEPMSSPFDLLSLDTILQILARAAKEEGTTLGSLASVSREFLGAARSLSKTLLVSVENGEGTRRTRSWRARPHGVWLMEDIKERPNLINLRVKGDMPAGLAAILSRLEWNNVKLPSIQCFDLSLQLLSRSKATLRSLDLEGNGQIGLMKDVLELLRSFPRLQSLTLRGTFKGDGQPEFSGEHQASVQAKSRLMKT